MLNLNINTLVANAIAQPAHPRVLLQPYESMDAFAAQAVARGCAAFTQANREAIKYSGADADVLQSELTAIETKMAWHQKEVLRLRGELIKQTGGQTTVDAATAAGVEVVYDAALVSGQYENERARYALSKQRDQINNQLVTANASARAKSDLATILAALLGDLE